MKRFPVLFLALAACREPTGGELLTECHAKNRRLERDVAAALDGRYRRECEERLKPCVAAFDVTLRAACFLEDGGTPICVTTALTGGVR